MFSLQLQLFKNSNFISNFSYHINKYIADPKSIIMVMHYKVSIMTEIISAHFVVDQFYTLISKIRTSNAAHIVQ